MNRHHLNFLTLVILCLSTTLRAQDTEARNKPNIVLILADDLGYGELGCYGQKKILTPNIDKLAKQGMRFTQAYSGSAVCGPSRCVLLTGQHPGHAQVRDNRAKEVPLISGTETLASMLKKQGYATGAFGKWGLGPAASSGGALKQGFDRFFGYYTHNLAHSYYPAYLDDNEGHFELNNKPAIPGHASLKPGEDAKNPASYAQFKGKDFAPDQINKQVLKFIRDNREKPFFIYYASIIPHTALHIPDQDLEPYLKLGWNETPFEGASRHSDTNYGYTPHLTPRAAYAAMITRLDTYVGRVMQELKTQGIDDNTLVIFTSDNGTTWLKREVDAEFFKSVGPLRGLKTSLYEGGIRVPLITRWPGKIKANSSSERITGFEDFLPTLAQISKSVVVPCDGIDFSPTLLGVDQQPRSFLYREFRHKAIIRRGDWKAVYTGSKKKSWELYNLKQDISEREDLSKNYPEKIKQFKHVLLQQHQASKKFPLRSLDSKN